MQTCVEYILRLRPNCLLAYAKKFLLRKRAVLIVFVNSYSASSLTLIMLACSSFLNPCLTRLEGVVRKGNKSSIPLSPVGHFKFDIDQQTFSRFILYHRVSYYVRFLRK